MTLTMPSRSTKEWERKHQEVVECLRANLKFAGVKLKPRRSPAFEAGATAKLTREARP